MKQKVSKILKKMLPIYEMDDLQEIFGYPNRRALNRALNSGTLPIRLFKLRGMRVCHVAVVEQYFENLKEEAMASLEAFKISKGVKSEDWDR